MKSKDIPILPINPRKGIWKGHKRAISHSIPPDMLDEVDALAKARCQSRTSLINFAISELLKAAKTTS